MYCWSTRHRQPVRIAAAHSVQRMKHGFARVSVAIAMILHIYFVRAVPIHAAPAVTPQPLAHVEQVERLMSGPQGAKG